MSAKSALGPRRKSGGGGVEDAVGPTRSGPLRAAKASGDVKSKFTEEEETYRVQNGKAICRLNGSLYFYCMSLI